MIPAVNQYWTTGVVISANCHNSQADLEGNQYLDVLSNQYLTRSVGAAILMCTSLAEQAANKWEIVEGEDPR